MDDAQCLRRENVNLEDQLKKAKAVSDRAVQVSAKK